MQIRVVLSAAVVEQQADAGDLQGISIEITDQTLPQRLREHITQRLLHAHRNSRQGSNGCGFCLATIFEVVPLCAAASADHCLISASIVLPSQPDACVVEADTARPGSQSGFWRAAVRHP